MTVRLRWILAGLGVAAVVGGCAWAGYAGLGLAAAGLMVFVLAAFS